MYEDLKLVWEKKINEFGDTKKLYVNNKGNVIKPIKKFLDKPLSLDNIDWNNLIIGNWLSLIIVFCLLFSAYAYKADVKQCYDLLEHPCTYANKIGCPGCVKPLSTDEFTYDNDWAEFNYTIQELTTA